MNRILLALAAFVLACAPAHAQSPLAVRPEQEVRIQAPESGLPGLTIATVMSVSADSVVVQTAVPDPVRGGRVLGQYTVPVAHLRRLEVLSGRGDPSGGMARGAVYGTGAGVFVLLFHKQFSRRKHIEVPCEGSPAECMFLRPRYRLEEYDKGQAAAIIGAGTLTGIVVGAIKPGRRWTSVLPRPVEAAVGPAQGGGVLLEGTIRF
jgi:hypothetical protein